LTALFIPILRTGLTALEGHPPARRAPLSGPITDVGGAEDLLTPREHGQTWRRARRGASPLRAAVQAQHVGSAAPASRVAETRKEGEEETP
jgi:surfactin synthase thioesterase subunit